MPTDVTGQDVPLRFMQQQSAIAAPSPVCVTGAANSISENTATLDGTVNPNGPTTTVWFEWSTSDLFSTFASTPSQGIGVGMSFVPVNQTLSGLNPGTRYYYRVAASNISGITLGSVESFITVPSQPVLVFPADGGTNIRLIPTLRWAPSLGATSYNLQVSTVSTFSYFAVNRGGITIPSFLADMLGTSNLYFWRVSATNESGTSTFSMVWSFTTVESQPDIPVCVSPVNGATSIPTTTTLLWQPSERAKSYRVQVSIDPSFTSLMVDSSGITGTSIAVSELTSQALYYWRVNAANDGGRSPYSAVWSFTTAAPSLVAPSLVFPPDGATGIPIAPTLSWNEVTGAASYRVQVSPDDTFSSSLVDSSVMTGPSLAINGLATNALYFWRVSAINVGGSGPFSSPHRFMTSGLTSAESPETGALLAFELSQNYPNPFNPTTRLEFRVPDNGPAVLRIIDGLGRELKVLFDDVAEAGRVQQVDFDAQDFPSGMYFAQLQFGTKQVTRKLTLVK